MSVQSWGPDCRPTVRVCVAREREHDLSRTSSVLEMRRKSRAENYYNVVIVFCARFSARGAINPARKGFRVRCARCSGAFARCASRRSSFAAPHSPRSPLLARLGRRSSLGSVVTPCSARPLGSSPNPPTSTPWLRAPCAGSLRTALAENPMRWCALAASLMRLG